MEKKVSVEMTMLRDLFEFLEQEQGTFAGNSEASAAFALLKEKHTSLVEINQTILQLSKSYLKERDRKIGVITEQFLQLSGLLKSLARKTNNSNLALQAHSTKSDLAHGRLEDRMNRATLLISLMKEVQSDFEGITNGAQIYQEMLTAYDAFSVENRMPVGRRVDASALRKTAKRLYKEIKALLELELDPALRTYSLTHLNFYNAYLLHRRTNKISSGKTKSNAEETGAANPAVEGANPTPDASTMP